jgi:glycosyltransferase involved in cell wall biosynthesis
MTFKVKKLLFIMESLAGGGAEKLLIDILNRIDTEKYKIDLYLLCKQGIYVDDLPPSVRVLPHPHSFGYRLARKICNKCNLTDIGSWVEKFYFRRLIKEKYDVGISFMEGLSLKYHSFIFDKFPKNISWIHTNLMKNHWSLHFFENGEQEASIYDKLSCIVFVSESAKIEFNKLIKTTRPIQKIIYNLIDKGDIIGKSKEYVVEKQKFTLCCVGRLSLQKGLDRAINVAKILKDKGHDFELWLLGEGENESTLREQVKRLNLTDCVKFWGFIKNPYPYMKAVDLFLMTSYTEGYPLVMCESICLGLPVVSTDITGVNEILDNGKYGILTGSQETEIADTLSELMSDPEKLKKLAQLSQERSEMFDPSHTMSDIYDLFE